MNVPSFPFLGFAILGAILYNLLPAGILRRGLLLLINLIFLSTFVHGWEQALPYAGFLLTGFLGTRLLMAQGPRWRLPVLIAVILFAFFWLKRYTFIPAAINLPFLYTTVGLSYVFFRVLHLIIDAGQGQIKERISPLDYLNYTLNFTALVSGPIQFYQDYREQERNGEKVDLFAAGWAAERIIVGMFKVAIVSTLLMQGQKAAIADLALASTFPMRVLYCAVIGAIYPLFLYANFSGYTDFVIGCARLFRIRLPENFHHPFIAENFIAFWSRWHITLSNWLKVYVYTPFLMTAMRRIPSPAIEPYLAVAAYFVTFFLVGAWHGQTSMFLFFGVLQGGGVAMNKLYQVAMVKRLSRKGYKKLSAEPWYRVFCRALTFTWFAFTLLWFWSTWGQLDQFIQQAGWPAVACGWALVLLVAMPALSLLRAVQGPIEARKVDPAAVPASRYWRTALSTALLIILIGTTVLLNGPAPDVVYKTF